MIYLKIVRWREIAADHPPRWRAAWTRFLALDAKRKLPLLFLTALLVYNGASVILSSKGIAFSGDEPHYVLNTVSLLRDGDLDLANNYAAADYHAYTAGQRRHPAAHRGRSQARQPVFLPFARRLVLSAALLRPGKGLGESALVLLLRFAMSLLGGLFGLQIYLYARREWGRETLALGLWALASFTTPVFFFSLHVYPEIVVALFSITVFRLFRFSERLTTGKLLLCGFLLPAFVWFHALKYVFILIPLFLYCVWTLRRRKTPLP